MLTQEINEVKFLRQVQLLKDLERSGSCSSRRSPSIATRVERQPGDVLMKQGDLGADLLLILEGTAKVDIDGRVVEEVRPSTACWGDVADR